MKRPALILLLAGPVLAQGGRDTGKGAPLLLFVRSERTAESKEIYDSAWKALEPHFGTFARERMHNFDGDKRQAELYFAEHAEFAVAVCFDRQSYEWCPDPKKAVLTQSRTDRKELLRVVRLLRPLARRVHILGKPDETLPGFEKVEAAKDADLVWVTEDYRGKVPDAGVPVVSTSPYHDGVVTVRPDPRGVGLQLAAQLLGGLKERRPVTKQRVVVDMDAAKARLPLPLLARADIVRRTK